MPGLDLPAIFVRATRTALDTYHAADESLRDPKNDAFAALAKVRDAMAEHARVMSESLALSLRTERWKENVADAASGMLVPIAPSGSVPVVAEPPAGVRRFGPILKWMDLLERLGFPTDDEPRLLALAEVLFYGEPLLETGTRATSACAQALASKEHACAHCYKQARDRLVAFGDGDAQNETSS